MVLTEGSAMRTHQTGFSLIELLIVVVIIGGLAAIAVPNFLAARRSANEASAIATMRVLHGAQNVYAATRGNGNFAGNTAFDTAVFPALAADAIIDGILASGQKDGYSFVGAKTSQTPTDLPQFAFSAVPTNTSGLTQTGARRFGVSTDGVVRTDTMLTHFTTIAAVRSAPPL